MLVAMGGIEHRLARNGFELLRQVADAEAGTFADGALVRRFFAENHAEQGRLAGAVRTDEADPRVRPQMRGGVGEQNLRGILFTDRFDLQHGAFDLSKRFWDARALYPAVSNHPATSTVG
jgi:hypothetical protein